MRVMEEEVNVEEGRVMELEVEKRARRWKGMYKKKIKEGKGGRGFLAGVS